MTTKKERKLLKEFLPAVNAFRAAIIKKFLKNEVKYGWGNKWLLGDWESGLQRDLVKHVAKGDPIDPGVLLTMAYKFGWRTAPVGTAEAMTTTTAAQFVEQFVATARVNCAVLYYQDSSEERYAAHSRNDLGDSWLKDVVLSIKTRWSRLETTPQPDQADPTTPKKRYIVDYTAGRVLDEVESTSTVAGMVGSGLVGKFLEWNEKYPTHHLALSDSPDLPGPAVGVAAWQYPNLHAYRLAQHNWANIILPYIQCADGLGLMVDARESGRNLYLDSVNIDMQQMGAESMDHTRALRQQLNTESANVHIQDHHITIKKGRPEDIMTEEQLAQYIADGGLVTRKEEYTPTVSPELAASANQIVKGAQPNE